MKLLALALLVLSPATSAMAASTAAPASAQADIVNSGSSNTRGYVLHVSRSGVVLVDAEDGSKPRSESIDPALAAKFFAALDASQPLDASSRGLCMKSASFGFSLKIRYLGASTPDLTCPGNEQTRTLEALASEIARAAHVSNTTPRRVPIGAPQPLVSASP